MSEEQRGEALRALKQLFGNRLRLEPIQGEEPGAVEALASVLPMNAEEVELLARAAPSHPSPRAVARELTSVGELPAALGREIVRREHTVLQGTVARSAEVLLLATGDPAEGWA
jgi:hypothetical protein